MNISNYDNNCRSVCILNGALIVADENNKLYISKDSGYSWTQIEPPKYDEYMLNLNTNTRKYKEYISSLNNTKYDEYMFNLNNRKYDDSENRIIRKLKEEGIL